MQMATWALARQAGWAMSFLGSPAHHMCLRLSYRTDGHLNISVQVLWLMALETQVQQTSDFQQTSDQQIVSLHTDTASSGTCQANCSCNLSPAKQAQAMKHARRSTALQVLADCSSGLGCGHTSEKAA